MGAGRPASAGSSTRSPGRARGSGAAGHPATASARRSTAGGCVRARSRSEGKVCVTAVAVVVSVVVVAASAAAAVVVSVVVAAVAVCWRLCQGKKSVRSKGACSGGRCCCCCCCYCCG